LLYAPWNSRLPEQNGNSWEPLKQEDVSALFWNIFLLITHITNFFLFSFLQVSKPDLLKCSLFTQINVLEGFKKLNWINYIQVFFVIFYFSRWVLWIFMKYLFLPAALRPLGLLSVLIEMSTKNVPGNQERPARKIDITSICESTV
jgi:hypothetical protein